MKLNVNWISVLIESDVWHVMWNSNFRIKTSKKPKTKWVEWIVWVANYFESFQVGGFCMQKFVVVVVLWFVAENVLRFSFQNEKF